MTGSTTARNGLGMGVGEAVATAGLVLVIFALVRTDRHAAVPGAVGAWIGAAIFFTASASFASPAVTLARAVPDTYTGTLPSSVPMFLAGQAVGTAAAVLLARWLYPAAPVQTRPPRMTTPPRRRQAPTSTTETPTRR